MPSQSQTYPTSNGSSKPVSGDNPKQVISKVGDHVANNGGVASIGSKPGSLNVTSETNNPEVQLTNKSPKSSAAVINVRTQNPHSPFFFHIFSLPYIMLLTFVFGFI